MSTDIFCTIYEIIVRLFKVKLVIFYNMVHNLKLNNASIAFIYLTFINWEN